MAAGGRVFFALQPPPAAAAELGRLAAWYERRCGGHAVAPENLHLTLLFLGQPPPDQVEAVRRVAVGVRCEPFDLLLDRIEYWPGPRLLCAVPSQASAPAAALAAALRTAVRGIAAVLMRPFAAHVTLLRRPQRLHELTLTPLTWPVDGFCLLRSEPAGRSVRYAVLDAWPCEAAGPRFSSR